MIIDAKHLSHFGVKGMRWGVRKQRKTERMRANSKRLEDKAADVINRALNDPTVKIRLNGQKTISGKEFVDKFFSGKIRLDVEKTDIIEEQKGR